MKQVAFGFGSNLSDKQRNIEDALDALFAGGKIEFLAASSFYRTAPWGHEAQDWFVNACALGKTALSAQELLERCKSIESDLGRTKSFRWGPRLIDIDLLWIEGETVKDADLVIPHKELFNRPFVLVPLAEICPTLEIGGRSVAEAAKTPSDVQQLTPRWRRPEPSSS